MLYSFIKMIAPFFLFFLVKLDLKGVENIPSKGPVVVISNHASNWDPLILAVYLPRKLSFMAKEELFKIFILGKIVTNLGAIPVKRGAADRNAIRQSIKVLEEGKALFMFPEGTRSKTGEIQDFLPGAAMIANKAGASVVPVGLTNTKKIGKVFFPKVTIQIGKPVNIHELMGDKATGKKLEEITEILKNKVIELVEN